jgi:DNA-binding MarR family transcriptional regulator
MKLSELIKQERFRSSGQESFLNIVVTSNWIMAELAATMAPFGVTPAQYNVLRILRGSHPRSLTCSAVGERLLDRTPDVTRLLNRLERAGLVSRERSSEDRRVVEVSVSEKGMHLLDRMQEQVEQKVDQLTGHLSAEEHRFLNELLERIREDQKT